MVGLAREVDEFLLDFVCAARPGCGKVPEMQSRDGILELLRIELVQLEEGGQVSVTIVSPCRVVEVLQGAIVVALPQDRLVKMMHQFELGEGVDEPGGVQRGASSESGGHGWPLAGGMRDDPECRLLLGWILLGEDVRCRIAWMKGGTEAGGEELLPR